MLGLARNAAVSIVVSPSLLSCATSATAADLDTEMDGNATCVGTASLTEGPFFVDEKLDRSDIRSDPVTGAVSQGVVLALTFNVSRIANSACSPLTGAYLDVWHCDSSGTYSDVNGNGNGSGGAGHKFLRGYQITDANGLAAFTTVYPGWYSGRAVHVHFKIRLFSGTTKTYEFTSQFFFDETLTDTVHALSPYSAKGRRNVVNTSDGIYNSLSSAEKAALTLQATKTSQGYNGVINLGVRVG